jgi:hypothetical protein
MARERFPPAAELYAFRLKGIGIDIDPMLLVQRAQVEFMETAHAMRRARAAGGQAEGHRRHRLREVIRALKKEHIPNDQLVRVYRTSNSALEKAIAKDQRGRPAARPMIMEPGLEAESAAQPAPQCSRRR